MEPDAVNVTWKIVPVNPYRTHLEEGSDVINLKQQKKKIPQKSLKDTYVKLISGCFFSLDAFVLQSFYTFSHHFLSPFLLAIIC